MLIVAIYIFFAIIKILENKNFDCWNQSLQRHFRDVTSVGIVESSSLAAGRVAPVDWSASLDLDATRLEEQCAPASKSMRF